MKSLLAAAALCLGIPAFAATASWTGESKQVQTVTYRYVTACKYQYLGRYFWVTVESSCPSSIEVQ